MRKDSRFQTRAFTLIEILVALGIFVMIIGIAAVNYQSANRRSRDGRRQADLAEIRTKLEIYRADNPGTGYPNPAWLDLIAALVPNYLQSVPQDPRPSLYSYYYESDPAEYKVCAYTETKVDTPCLVPGPPEPSCGLKSCNYCECSP